MTEEEARDRACAIAGPAFPTIERYADLLIAESARQNLISTASISTIWSRHLLDSLQLVAFARDADATWIDIGSGAGLPGIVVAALGRWQVTLAEPRARRAQFLSDLIDALDLRDTVVVKADAKTITGHFDVVSARAVAPVREILMMSRGFASSSTRFVLPKGRSAADDIVDAQRDWQGVFHVEQSITDPASGIVLVDRATRR